MAVTQNGVGFACTSLAIGKNTTIVALRIGIRFYISTGFDSILANVLIDFLLSTLVVGDVIKDEILFFIGGFYYQCFLLLVGNIHASVMDLLFGYWL